MSTDEYVPSDQDMRWQYVVKRMNDGATWTHAEREYTRWLAAHDARVRRDAAREALDGYADALNRNRSAAVWEWPEFVADVREWAAYNYPEETPVNYPTPYGKSDDLALENERLKALVRELKQREDPWTQVFDCEVSHEEPYDFEYCTTHDRTFEKGGMCEHAGLSEIDYLTDREMTQRGRAVRAEMKLEKIEWTAREASSLIDAEYILQVLGD